MNDVNISRTFDAPRDLVFTVWTDPKHLAQWWGPHHFTNPRCEIDARPGGAIHIDMRGPDGTVYPMKGEVKEIARPERFVFSSIPIDDKGNVLFEVLTTVTFAERSGKTTVSVNAHVVRTVAPEAAQMLAGMEAGWTQSLERLEEYVRHVNQ
jgi:uncharacterized protein YndB with AHSA1/START domain